MNPQVKEWWLYHLRSGKLEQTYLQLVKISAFKTHVTYCPLGILCAIYNGVISPKKNLWDGEWFLDCCAYLPKEVSDWSGLTIEIQNEITYLGDTKRWSFSKIANWIEKNL